MKKPLATQLHEPALFARSTRVHTQSLVPGKTRILLLEAGDQLTVVNVEGNQQAEILALNEQGLCALESLGLSNNTPNNTLHQSLSTHTDCPDAFKTLIQQLNPLPSSVNLWDEALPAGYRLTLIASDKMWIVLSIPDCKTPVDSQARSSELELILTRLDAQALPTLPSPLGEVVNEFTLHPGTARAYPVKAGEYIQVIDVAGRQCSDFVAFDFTALNQGQCVELDPTVTRTLNGHAYPGPGLFSKFFDQQMQPMLEVIQDTVGRHDSFALACTARYYESMGYMGHDNCSDNISHALQPFGIPSKPGWPAINFFFNTQINEHQQMTLDEPWSRPGDYVLLRALKDLLCVSTSCPDDIDPANGWMPTDIHIRLYSAQEHFSPAMSTRTLPNSEPVLTRKSGFYPHLSALTQHFTEYRGWWLPTHFNGYGSLQEYYGCRERVAVMDLSALRKFDILGPDAEALLNYCLTRDIRKLAVGQVVYSAMCYEHGGMLDDGTLLRLGPDNFRWICGEDYAGIWLREQAAKLNMKVWIKSATDQIHNLAVQGPLSRELLTQLIWTPATQPSVAELGWFRLTIGRLNDYNGCPLMVTRTGYTGELGYEIWCHPDDATALWTQLWEKGKHLGLVPLGLEALDMLRIEAGLVFAGYEFCDQTDPFTAGIGFCVPLKSKQDEFIGREALLARQAHPQHKLMGLRILGNETAHHGDRVYQGRAQVGVVTSATRSPITGQNIALCRLDVRYCTLGTPLQLGKLDGHQKRLEVEVCAPIFYDPDKTRVRS